MPSETIKDVAKKDLAAVEAFLARKRKALPAQALLEAAWRAEPDVRRYLAERAAQKPIDAAAGEIGEAHAAAMIGTAEALSRADARGADFNASYNPWQTALSPLETAIKFDELAFAKALLERGVATDSPQSSEHRPHTALSTAIELRNLEAVRLLLAHGVAPTDSVDLPGVGFDLDVLDQLVAAGLDLNVLRDGSSTGWGAWHLAADVRVAWMREMVARGYVLGLEQFSALLDDAAHNPEATEALCEGLLDIGGDALAARIPDASDELMELAWEQLTFNTLVRLVELGAPVAVKRVKRAWVDHAAKAKWLEERGAAPLKVPPLAELMTLADDQLSVEVLVAALLSSPDKGASDADKMALAGIRLGASAAEVSALGLDLDEDIYESDADESTSDAASHSLEIGAEDGVVTSLGYQLRLPDDARPDAIFAAFEDAFAARFGRKGKGRKGKKRKWELGDATLELSRHADAGGYPLDVTINIDVF